MAYKLKELYITGVIAVVNAYLPVSNVVDYFLFYGPQIVTNLVLFLLIFIFLFCIGYLIGLLVSVGVRQILFFDRVQSNILKYGATSKSTWSSMVRFFAEFTKWIIVLGFLSITELKVLWDIFDFVWALFVFSFISMVGILLGDIVYKLLKDGLIALGLEDGLKTYNIANSFGGVPASNILASIGKWYVVILFVSSGLAYFPGGSDFGLYTFMNSLVVKYVPQFISGVLIVLASLAAANFVGNRLKQDNVPFSDVLALGAEVVIIFFGIVIALPEFGVEDVSILADSFKILMFGVALGFAIAFGFGLKDSVSRMAEKLSR